MIIPKGGFQKIKQESEAVLQDTWYVLPIDDKTAKIIVVDKCGKKREIGDVLIGEDKFLPLNGTILNRPLKGNVKLAPSETSDGKIRFEGDNLSYIEFDANGNIKIQGATGGEVRLNSKFWLESSYGAVYRLLYNNTQNGEGVAFAADAKGYIYASRNTKSVVKSSANGLIICTKEYVDEAIESSKDNTYSPIEKQIGWHEYYVNNVLVKKPLYRRIFEFTTITGGIETVTTGLNNLSVINIKGTIVYNGITYKLGTRVAKGAGVDDYIIHNYDVVVNGNNLVVVSNWVRPANSSGNVIQDLPDVKYNIILEYTKTTDSATEVNP